MEISTSLLILITVTVSSASNTSPNINTYLLATALFYTDDQGRILLVSGALPAEVDHTIKDDLHNRIPEPNVEVKVVPAFQDITDIPMNKNILDHLKALHPNVYIINLSQFQSRKIMEAMVEHIHRRQNKKNNDSKLELNQVHNAKTTKKQNNATYELDSLESAPKDYVPNDIYYGVEMRCANWADGCNPNSGSFLSMPSKYIEIPLMEYQRPRQLNWWP